MRKLVIASASAVALLVAAPAQAVNHPFIPADECATSEGAGGEPAFDNLVSAPGTPFLNRQRLPQGQLQSDAPAHCRKAQP